MGLGTFDLAAVHHRPEVGAESTTVQYEVHVRGFGIGRQGDRCAGMLDHTIHEIREYVLAVRPDPGRQTAIGEVGNGRANPPGLAPGGGGRGSGPAIPNG